MCRNNLNVKNPTCLHTNTWNLVVNKQHNILSLPMAITIYTKVNKNDQSNVQSLGIIPSLDDFGLVVHDL